MAKTNSAFLAFNHGEISASALARIDVEKLRLAAQEQINWMPTKLGPMSLRPGLGYIGATKSNLVGRNIPFVFSLTDTAVLEMTDSVMRVRVDDELITRPSVSTTVGGGDFATLAGWTLAASAGCTTEIVGGTLVLYATARGGVCTAIQGVVVALGEQTTEHSLRIVVDRGPVTFRCGYDVNTDELVAETELDSGVHSLSFTPNALFFVVQFESRVRQPKIIESIQIEAAGVMEIPTPWTEDDLHLIRYDQSGDIVFAACNGLQQRKIERRGERSWSVVKYQSDDGPFKDSTRPTVRMAIDSTEGLRALTADRAFFTPDHVGALIRIFTPGQSYTCTLAAEETFTTPTKVTGSGADRQIGINILNSWTGTIRLQRSTEGPDTGFVDVSGQSWTANVGVLYTDTGLDEVETWYRIGFKSGDYSSGAATCFILWSGGGDWGVGRIVAFGSSTSVSLEILKQFPSTAASNLWFLSEWSDASGWPDAVRFHDGRLWFAGRDRLWGSVSDNFTSFDVDTIGDAGPILRSVGFGPVDTINDLLSLTRLLVMRQMAETSVRSSALDEPLTPTNFSLKDCSTQGSARLPAIRIDNRGMFVQQSNRRVYELGLDLNAADYVPIDLTRLNTDIGSTGFVAIAVQRQPDTRIHFVRGDGKIAILVRDPSEEVICWVRLETDGIVEDVCVVPGEVEDHVYYIIKRNINGSDVRYIEKLARADECIGATLNKQADSFLSITQASSTTITGLTHLEGETVVIWANGKDLGTKVVTGGQIAGLSEAVTTAIVGLGYDATFKSAKLAYAAQFGVPLNQKKKIDKVGLVLLNTHYQGLQTGQDFDHMDNLPLVEGGQITAADTVWSEFDAPMTAIPGEWGTDSRLCLKASAPRPCTVAAAVFSITTHERG